ncbi:putative pumilio homolog 7, chloroplastic [Vigna radiata var. radiata]|uniref:Pumilio homolog 7, chloroplastic n=1 Tax=Vigna radiata var. radiata TaxID=3916 RepID=A0A3Q0FD60_VIGRR|nr:putative pumilio homolog 7, chloroplastic [Vigna radiata var. radiata]
MDMEEDEDDHPFPFMLEHHSGVTPREEENVVPSSSTNVQLSWEDHYLSCVDYFINKYPQLSTAYAFHCNPQVRSSSSPRFLQDSSETLASRMESLNLSNLGYETNQYHEACLQRVRNIESANATVPTRHHHGLRHYTLETLRGGWFSMAKDPRGSRVVQQMIEEGTPQDNFHMVNELQYHLHELIKHSYGSFVILKLFQSRNISVHQKNTFIHFITADQPKLRDLCIHDLGGRVIQQILEVEDVLIAIDQITRAMSSITVALMKNYNGGYVILQCLKVFPREHKNAILDVVAQNCHDIAVNKNGCCNIQKIIHHDDVPAFRSLTQNLISNAEDLAKDQYGNYVLQFLVKKKIPEVNAMLVSELRYKFVGLSIDKYASNVVEDLLHYSRTEIAAIIAEEIMESPIFLQVVQHQYGNYVVQRALQYTKGFLHESLCAIILSNQERLSSCLHGKMVLHVAQKSKRLRG